MASAIRNGIRLRYETRGSGPAILFLHGFTATRALWSAQMAALPGSLTGIAMDLRGHAESESGPQDTYSIRSLAADALAVLDDAGCETAIIAGHSLGGMIAQHMAVHCPSRVSGLVLSSTTCLAPDPQRFKPLIEGAIALADMPEEERAAHPLLCHSVPLDAATAWGCGKAILNLKRYDLELSPFTKPALVIFGDDDSDNIKDGSALLAKALPAAVKLEIPGSGHVPQLSHTDVYTAALSEFLNDAAAS